jgi:hypothetical protein
LTVSEPSGPIKIEPITILRVLLAIIPLSFLAIGEPSPKQGFTFPQVSNASVSNVSNLVVRSNDSMVVEYGSLPYSTAVGIAMNCSNTVEDAIQSEVYEAGWYPDGPSK